jgi:hypothetical protein
MINARVTFGYNKHSGFQFYGAGQVIIYDTCLIVSGQTLRFRLPFAVSIFQNLLAVPTFRTIPYGAVKRYWASFSWRGRNLGRGLFRRMHVVVFQLPTGKTARVSFTLRESRTLEKQMRARMDENVMATKALFTR